MPPAIPGVRVAPARTEYEQRVSQFGAEHGVEVVFFESPARLPLVGLSQRPGVVLVQRNQHPAAAVLGIMLHELGHDIRNRQPEAFDAVARWVEETRPDLWKFAGEDLEGYADLTPEKRREETLTYLLHENATAIVRAIANREELRAAGEPRGPAARVWEWIKDFLTKAVRALGVQLQNHPGCSRRTVLPDIGSDLVEVAFRAPCPAQPQASSPIWLSAARDR